MANVYWGDGGFGGASHGDGNWNTVGNWYSTLSSGCPCSCGPGTPLGRVPQAGDSVVLAGFVSGTQDVTTGPANWAGPVAWLLNPGKARSTSLAAGVYSGTITLKTQGISVSEGIKGGTFSGLVQMQGTVANPASGMLPSLISGGTFTGTVTRTVAVGNQDVPANNNSITGGIYSPAVSCALGPSNILNDTGLPTDPGFALGGGTYGPVITVTGITAVAAAIPPAMNVGVLGSGNIPEGRYTPPFPAP